MDPDDSSPVGVHDSCDTPSPSPHVGHLLPPLSATPGDARCNPGYDGYFLIQCVDGEVIHLEGILTRESVGAFPWICWSFCWMSFLCFPFGLAVYNNF